MAHPLDDGSAAVLHRDVESPPPASVSDAGAYQSFVEPLVERWATLADGFLAPLIPWPRTRSRWPGSASSGVPSVSLLARRFQEPAARALLAGLAAHSFLPLEPPLTGGIGLSLGLAAHAVGWPVAAGGTRRHQRRPRRRHHGPRGRDRDRPRGDGARRAAAGQGHVARRDTPAARRPRRRQARLEGLAATGVAVRTGRVQGRLPAVRPGAVDERRLPAGRRRPPRRSVRGRRRRRGGAPPRRHGGAAVRARHRSRRWPTPSGPRAGGTCCGPTATCPTATAPTTRPALEGQLDRFAPGWRDLVVERESSAPPSTSSRTTRTTSTATSPGDRSGAGSSS